MAKQLLASLAHPVKVRLPRPVLAIGGVLFLALDHRRRLDRGDAATGDLPGAVPVLVLPPVPLHRRRVLL